jgi:hypothetical protein
MARRTCCDFAAAAGSSLGFTSRRPVEICRPDSAMADCVRPMLREADVASCSSPTRGFEMEFVDMLINDR